MIISCSSIHHLRIQNVNFTPAGIEHLARGFLSLYGRVKEFSLRGCNLGDEAAAIIAECMEQSSSSKPPTFLNLSDNRITAVGLQALLSAAKKVERLNLSGNILGVAGAELLAKYLESNTSLKVLYLDQVALGNAGLEAVMKSLEKNKTLLELHCGENNIDHRVRSWEREKGQVSESVNGWI